MPVNAAERKLSNIIPLDRSQTSALWVVETVVVVDVVMDEEEEEEEEEEGAKVKDHLYNVKGKLFMLRSHILERNIISSQQTKRMLSAWPASN